MSCCCVARFRAMTPDEELEKRVSVQQAAHPDYMPYDSDTKGLRPRGVVEECVCGHVCMRTARLACVLCTPVYMCVRIGHEVANKTCHLLHVKAAQQCRTHLKVSTFSSRGQRSCREKNFISFAFQVNTLLLQCIQRGFKGCRQPYLHQVLFLATR